MADTWVQGYGFVLDEDDDEGRGPRIVTIQCVECQDSVPHTKGNSPTDDMWDHVDLHIHCHNKACDGKPLLDKAFRVRREVGSIVSFYYCNEDCWEDEVTT